MRPSRRAPAVLARPGPAHNNHHDADVVKLFERFALTAPGSYGILSTHDDEANLWSLRDPFADEIGERASHWYCRA